MSFSVIPYIPNAPNNPADDQPIMKQNFANTVGFLSVDHTAPGVTGAGNHQQVHLLNKAAPGFSAPSTGVLYANAGPTNSWPFWQNAVGSAFQLAGDNLSTANNGQAFLPGGIIIKWGAITSTSSTFQTLSFIPAFPLNCFTVYTNPYGSNDIPDGNATIKIRKSTVNKNSFEWVFVTSSSKYTGFFWLAIGN